MPGTVSSHSCRGQLYHLTTSGVTEGDGVSVTLRGKAFGFYANPIEIGVFCAPVDVTGVPAGRDKH